MSHLRMNASEPNHVGALNAKLLALVTARMHLPEVSRMRKARPLTQVVFYLQSEK